jgi:hypothetical protein
MSSAIIFKAARLARRETGTRKAAIEHGTMPSLLRLPPARFPSHISEYRAFFTRYVRLTQL